MVGGYYLVSPFQICMRAIKPVDYSFKPVTTWEAAPSKGGILHQKDQFGFVHSFKVSGYTPTVTEKQRINDYFADLIKDKSSESQLKSGRRGCNKRTKW